MRNRHATRPWQHVLDPVRGYLLLAERLWTEPGRVSGAWNFGPSNEDAVTVNERQRLLPVLHDGERGLHGGIRRKDRVVLVDDDALDGVQALLIGFGGGLEGDPAEVLAVRVHCEGRDDTRPGHGLHGLLGALGGPQPEARAASRARASPAWWR